MSVTASSNALPQLSIKVLYSDDSIIVIDKPCNLRSVPGHANQPALKPITDDEECDPDEVAPETPVAHSLSHRRTSQEAWVEAIHFVGKEGNEQLSNDMTHIFRISSMSEQRAINELLRNLGAIRDPSSVPRKCSTFERYCQRNHKRLLPSFTGLDGTALSTTEPSRKRKKPWDASEEKSNSIHPSLERIVSVSYSLIQKYQRSLLNLPQPTDDVDSALGQLRLLGFGDYANHSSLTSEFSDDGCKMLKEASTNEKSNKSNKSNLYIVHRLDCQTSGVMVVARNRTAASSLCRHWRERRSVEKVYLARVKRWPLYDNQQLTEGIIDLPLAPSRTERIKWEIRPLEQGGKTSLTSWKLFHENNTIGQGSKSSNCSTHTEMYEHGLTLELQPITGRTHQLRIHCAAVGSGIEGDSLYGDLPVEWLGDNHKQPDKTKASTEKEVPRLKTLQLHAHKLTFPHPETGNSVTFISPKPW